MGVTGKIFCSPCLHQPATYLFCDKNDSRYVFDVQATMPMNGVGTKTTNQTFTYTLVKLTARSVATRFHKNDMRFQHHWVYPYAIKQKPDFPSHKKTCYTRRSIAIQINFSFPLSKIFPHNPLKTLSIKTSNVTNEAPVFRATCCKLRSLERHAAAC